jgi:hypothetical protein
MNNEERAKKNRENVRKWKAENPDKVREQARRYFLRHREQRLVYMRKHAQEVRDKARKYDEMTGGAEE